MMRQTEITLFAPVRLWDDASTIHNGKPEEVGSARGYLEQGPMNQQQTDMGIGDDGNWMWIGRFPLMLQLQLDENGHTPAKGWEATTEFGATSMRFNVISAFKGISGEWQLRLSEKVSDGRVN